MTQTYFLGANSMNGFASLYDNFPGGRAMLHIIKGCPGNGKSNFMRRIGRAAEGHGHDVEYILCSGDPDSLDGVYIPALRQAWVDGTAPHVIEPSVFGASGDYVNLGRFCRLPISGHDRERMLSINRRYKGLYKDAYEYLASAGHLQRFHAMAESDGKDAVREIIDSAMLRDNRPGRIEKRFMSAHSCFGRVMLTEEISKLCKLVIKIENPALMSYAAELAAKLGAEVILCLYPLCPEIPEAVLMPKLGLAFVSPEWQLDAVQYIHCELSDDDPGDIEEHILSLTYKKLSEAKTLHDALEAVYKPYIDYKALEEYTEEVIKEFIH